MCRVAVIILNYRRREDTLECLASVARLTYPNVQIYLIDQASGDGTSEAVRAAFPAVQVIENPANNGFAAGNNGAIRRALGEGADYVFLLNNDTVVAPDLLDKLVEACDEDASLAVAGPLMLSYDEPETVWSSGGAIGCAGESRLRDLGRKAGEFDAVAALLEPEFVVGCGLFAPRRTWECTGLFDERYFCYYEDADWCARVRTAGCGRIATVPAARLWHKVGRSLGTASDRTLYYMQRNVLLYLEKNRTRRYALGKAYGNALRLLAVLWVKGERRRAGVVWRALIDYHKRRFGAADF